MTNLRSLGLVGGASSFSGVPVSSTRNVDLCSAWNNGSAVAAITPATPLTVTFTNGSATATVTSGTAPASGAIIGDATAAGTTFTASGNTLTLSAPATATGSKPAWAGQDITSALQAAINYFAAQATDGTVLFSKPGFYLINGALQSGTALTRAYNGQILVPARALDATTGLISIRIKGPQPFAGMPGGGIPQAAGGVTLLANPGTGSVFDSIAGYGGGNIGTAITMVFDDIQVMLPSNPQGTAIDGTGFAGLVFRGGCAVTTIAPGAASGLTGSGYGVKWPISGNMAMLHQSGEMAIDGYPNGTNTGEHMVYDYLFLQHCKNGIVSGKTPHAVRFAKCVMQGVVNGITPTHNEALITGFFDIGDSPPDALFNDPTNLVRGNIELLPMRYGDINGLGFASNGGQEVAVRLTKRERSAWPRDTFGRVNGSLPLTQTYGPGGTDITGHIWAPTTPVVINSGGGLTSAAASNPKTWLKYNTGRANPSRIVRVKVTTGTTGYNAYIILGRTISGGPNQLYVQLNNGNLVLQKTLNTTPTTLATAAGVLAASTAYTVDCVISNPYSAAGAFTVTIYLNGTQQLTWTMAAGDAGGNSITQLLDGDLYQTQDGFGMFSDTTTKLTEFSILPA